MPVIRATQLEKSVAHHRYLAYMLEHTNAQKRHLSDPDYELGQWRSHTRMKSLETTGGTTVQVPEIRVSRVGQRLPNLH
jgi:hypothetical protein